MIKKIIGSKQESANGKAKKSKGGFSLQIEEEEVSQETTSPSKPVQPADTPDWVKLLYKKTEASQESTTTQNNTFADQYLLTMSTTSRRRPGGSLSQYMDMAGQMKTPMSKG